MSKPVKKDMYEYLSERNLGLDVKIANVLGQGMFNVKVSLFGIYKGKMYKCFVLRVDHIEGKDYDHYPIEHIDDDLHTAIKELLKEHAGKDILLLKPGSSRARATYRFPIFEKMNTNTLIKETRKKLALRLGIK